MDWLDEVRARQKRKNQMLFGLDSALLQPLSRLIAASSHRAVVLWAFELADESVEALQAGHPGEARPAQAVAVSRAWAAGQEKMPAAKRAILQCHAAAKEMDDPADIALCHAIGQACGTVHTTGHALGFPIYELTAIVRRHGVENCRAPAEARARHYEARLLHWQNNYKSHPGAWAAFMLAEPGEP